MHILIGMAVIALLITRYLNWSSRRLRRKRLDNPGRLAWSTDPPQTRWSTRPIFTDEDASS